MAGESQIDGRGVRRTRLGTVPLAFLILLMSMFGPISTDMCLAGFPQMVVEFGTEESVLNMALYMFMLVFAVSMLFLGPLSDKFGRRRILAVTMAIYVVSNLLASMSEDVWTFIALRMIQAFGAGGAMVTSFSLIKDCFRGRMFMRMLSVVAVIGVLGPILAPVIGAALINAFDWRATFMAPAVVGAVCLTLGLLLPGSLPDDRFTGSVIGAVSNLRKIMRERAFAAFVVMMCIFIAGQLGYISVSTYVYQDQFGLSTTMYSLVLGAACIMGLAIAMVVKRLHLKNLTMVKLMLTLGAISTLVMFLGAPNAWWLFMLAIVPCSANLTISRIFGFGLLMNHHDGDNGSVSAVINFTTFMFAFAGMVVASSFPPDLFIQGVGTVMLAACIVFSAMWALVKKRGYPIKNFL